jgi:enamine deaminase RidA (YjgF/YER057c/UK114 family)
MSKIRRLNLSANVSKLYSDAVLFGDCLSISGMLPVDEQGNIVGKGDAAAQAEQVFRNIGRLLKEAGADFSQVVKLNIYLTNVDDRTAIQPVRAKYFPPEALPASTLLEISRLANPDALLEIEALVYLG